MAWNSYKKQHITIPVFKDDKSSSTLIVNHSVVKRDWHSRLDIYSLEPILAEQLGFRKKYFLAKEQCWCQTVLSNNFDLACHIFVNYDMNTHLIYVWKYHLLIYLKTKSVQILNNACNHSRPNMLYRCLKHIITWCLIYIVKSVWNAS